MMLPISQDRLDELDYYLRINYPIYLVSFKEQSVVELAQHLEDVYTIAELFSAEVFELVEYDQDGGILNTIVLKDIIIFYDNKPIKLKKDFTFDIRLDRVSNKNFIAEYYG